MENNNTIYKKRLTYPELLELLEKVLNRMNRVEIKLNSLLYDIGLQKQIDFVHEHYSDPNFDNYIQSILNPPKKRFDGFWFE